MKSKAGGSGGETRPDPEAGRGDSAAGSPVSACSGRFLRRRPTQQGDMAKQR